MTVFTKHRDEINNHFKKLIKLYIKDTKKDTGTDNTAES